MATITTAAPIRLLRLILGEAGTRWHTAAPAARWDTPTATGRWHTAIPASRWDTGDDIDTQWR